MADALTRRESKSCSTWCSTTPPKAITPPRRYASAPWTARPTTGWIPATPGRYLDTTGCGNSLNAGDPLTLQLRWAGTEMTDVTWSDPNALATALYLDGCDAPDRAADRPVRAVSSEPHRAASECDWIAALRAAWYVRDTGVRCNALAYVRAIRNPSRGELI
jgi:hypothetical protein